MLCIKIASAFAVMTTFCWRSSIKKHDSLIYTLVLVLRQSGGDKKMVRRNGEHSSIKLYFLCRVIKVEKYISKYRCYCFAPKTDHNGLEVIRCVKWRWRWEGKQPDWRGNYYKEIRFFFFFFLVLVFKKKI